jgi:hypothetical protein
MLNCCKLLQVEDLGEFCKAQKAQGMKSKGVPPPIGSSLRGPARQNALPIGAISSLECHRISSLNTLQKFVEDVGACIGCLVCGGCKVTLRRLRPYRPVKIVHHKDHDSQCIEYNISIVPCFSSVQCSLAQFGHAQTNTFPHRTIFQTRIKEQSKLQLV